jgi:hypothetical protein
VLLWCDDVQSWTRRRASCLSGVWRWSEAAIDVGVVVRIRRHIPGPDWGLGISLLGLLERNKWFRRLAFSRAFEGGSRCGLRKRRRKGGLRHGLWRGNGLLQ